MVDDSLATGATMQSAIAFIRGHIPCRLAIAIPIASISTYKELEDQVDDIICP